MYPLNMNVPETSTDQERADTDDHRATRSSLGAKQKHICFVCNVVNDGEASLAYTRGGLARCGYHHSLSKLKQAQSRHLADSSSRFHMAAERLRLLQSGHCYDEWASDVYYHQKCYVSFTYFWIPRSGSMIDKLLENEAMKAFDAMVTLKVICERNAYLLKELMDDLKGFCEEYGIPPIWKSNSILRQHLEDKFEQIDFFTIPGKYTIVHSVWVSPFEYSVASLKGIGLRDNDYVLSFARFIKKKVVRWQESGNFQVLEPNDITDMEQTPLPDLYNVIYNSMYSYSKLNEYGFASTESQNIATKIWSLSLDWTSLILGVANKKQCVLSLTMHRLTGKREPVEMLERLGAGISYNKVLKTNQSWYESQPKPHQKFKNVKSVYSTLDNVDIKNDTRKGDTIHHTNCCVYFPILSWESPEDYFKSAEEIKALPAVNSGCLTVPYYQHGIRSEPNPLGRIKDICFESTLEECLKKDVLWALVYGFSNIDIDTLPVGTWTIFNQQVSSTTRKASILEYEPQIPQKPSLAVCKVYLDSLLETIKDLQLHHVFSFADEDIYCKLLQIIWKHPSLYAKIIPILGGFHQLKVRQKLIYKRHCAVGYKQWAVDSGIVRENSSEQAFDGRHYYRTMNVVKSRLCALLQFRMEQLTSNYGSLDDGLKSKLTRLAKEPSPSTCSRILECQAFNEFFKEVIHAEGEQARVTWCYIRDVSALLALVSAVRESDFERHLAAERQMLPLLFSYNHFNYSRYNTYQHFFLLNLKKNQPDVYKDIIERGIGANYSEGAFKSVHPDLVTEYENREMKGSAGPYKSAFSTNQKNVDRFVATAHIHAKLRTNFRETLRLKSSGTHKENTESGRKKIQKGC